MNSSTRLLLLSFACSSVTISINHSHFVKGDDDDDDDDSTHFL